MLGETGFRVGLVAPDELPHHSAFAAACSLLPILNLRRGRGDRYSPVSEMEGCSCVRLKEEKTSRSAASRSSREPQTVSHIS